MHCKLFGRSLMILLNQQHTLLVTCVFIYESPPYIISSGFGSLLTTIIIINRSGPTLVAVKTPFLTFNVKRAKNSMLCVNLQANKKAECHATVQGQMRCLWTHVTQKSCNNTSSVIMMIMTMTITGFSKKKRCAAAEERNLKI